MRKKRSNTGSAPDKTISTTVRLPYRMIEELKEYLNDGGVSRNRFLVESLDQVSVEAFVDEHGDRRTIILRLPKPLHKRITRIAVKSGCSISQIVASVVSHRLGH